MQYINNRNKSQVVDKYTIVEYTDEMLKLAIQQILEKRGLTTAAFAEGAQIAPNTALALRRGTTQRIDMQTLEKVCRFLQIKPGQAFLYEPDPPQN